MDMVVNAMRERARCISLIKEKYPGLPYYDLDTLPVLRLISRVLDNIPFDFDYHKKPRYSLEERMRAHRWERVCEANSYLSSVLGRDLDWMYEIGEAYYYAKGAGTKFLQRMRVRTPTNMNIPALVKILQGCDLADVPMMVLTIDPCISCTER